MQNINDSDYESIHDEYRDNPREKQHSTLKEKESGPSVYDGMADINGNGENTKDIFTVVPKKTDTYISNRKNTSLLGKDFLNFGSIKKNRIEAEYKILDIKAVNRGPKIENNSIERSRRTRNGENQKSKKTKNSKIPKNKLNVVDDDYSRDPVKSKVHAPQFDNLQPTEFLNFDIPKTNRISAFMSLMLVYNVSYIMIFNISGLSSSNNPIFEFKKTGISGDKKYFYSIDQKKNGLTCLSSFKNLGYDEVNFKNFKDIELNKHIDILTV